MLMSRYSAWVVRRRSFSVLPREVWHSISSGCCWPPGIACLCSHLTNSVFSLSPLYPTAEGGIRVLRVMWMAEHMTRWTPVGQMRSTAVTHIHSLGEKDTTCQIGPHRGYTGDERNNRGSRKQVL